MKRPLLAALSVAAALGGLATISRSQDDAKIEPLKRRVNDFFRQLAQEKDPAIAFDRLLEGGPLERHPRIKVLVEKVANFDSKYGDFSAAVPISERAVGPDQQVVLLKYLYEAQEYPVVWNFTFYRQPASRLGDTRKWVVVGVRFDTDLEALAQTSPTRARSAGG